MDYLPDPPDEADLCAICHGDVDGDQCVCEPCPDCLAVGDPACLAMHRLELTPQQETAARRRVTLWKARQPDEEALERLHREGTL